METGYLLSFKASPLKDYLVVLTHLHNFFDIHALDCGLDLVSPF